MNDARFTNIPEQRQNVPDLSGQSRVAEMALIDNEREKKRQMIRKNCSKTNETSPIKWTFGV